MPSQPSISFPPHFTPGKTSNFVSNETIAAGISASAIWALLADISQWKTYYKNCAQITPPEDGPQLRKGSVFKFSTFGFPPLTCEVKECVAPRDKSGGGEEGEGEGRLAWQSETPEGLEIYHAWLVQDLEGGRVRVLTQESQIGPVFAEWNEQKPNKMLLGHQDWLDGLVSKARGEEIGVTNLERVGFPVRQIGEEEVRKADVQIGV
ncbi:hypothetical protein E8E13_002153 [Curvularia kusanoi]|uniref:Uncharacterized protein n=1 Tax=Curvularia kusanoi TaxID=90978 RepID=A0A9P4W5W7_CURKU|nr:hypothetical protein E8E13_002153 [Curvularia kusanoi]